MHMSYATELQAARQAAELASKEIMEVYAGFEVIADAPADISTEADRRSQDAILCYLTDRFPADAFCAEEATESLGRCRRDGPRLWIIDPIDGSRGFAKKLGEFSVMIALVEEGEVRLGVVVEPARDRRTYAVKGGGCWRQDAATSPQQCRVSAVRNWHESTLVRSWSEKKHFHPSLTQVKSDRFTYSAGIKLAMVARGEADLYLSTYTGFSSWDVAAGQILVEEAGGKITDAAGQALRYRQDGQGAIRGTVASNGALHERGLALLKELLR
jgi:3'(2'), 5'-bisphosphate nucleotidase